MNRSLRFVEWLCTFALLSLFLLSACSTEMPKYQIGMSMDSAKAKMSKPYEVKHAAIDYENGPTDEQIRNDPVFLIDVEDEGIGLFFNAKKELVSIRRKDKK
jgi:hypothetical protein